MVQTHLFNLRRRISNAFSDLILSKEDHVDESNHTDMSQIQNLEVRFRNAARATLDIGKRTAKFAEKCEDAQTLHEEAFRGCGCGYYYEEYHRRRSNETSLDGVRRLRECLEDDVFHEDLETDLKKCLKELLETHESVKNTIMMETSGEMMRHGGLKHVKATLSSMEEKLDEAIFHVTELIMKTTRAQVGVNLMRESSGWSESHARASYGGLARSHMTSSSSSSSSSSCEESKVS